MKTWTSDDLGVDLSDLNLDDMGDFFRAWDRCKKAKKALNQQWSTEALRLAGIKFESKNFGNHLIVHHDNMVVDFWPSTGKWIVRAGRKGRGIRKLLELLT
jgi:hypothetical protein